ncbi:MAG: hypothetical protein NTZ05_20230 [Chloroflexi bacterium]|nr:hypothetical protein [Chloroflexota bacterium]
MSNAAIASRLRSLLEVGKRNSATDARTIQAIHDGAAHLGAVCTAPDDAPTGDAQQAEAARWIEDATALLESELSHQQIADALRTAVKEKAGPTIPSGYVYCWIRDVFDTWFVYEAESGGNNVPKLYKTSYLVGADGKVTLVGQPVEVMPQTNYVSIGEAAQDVELSGDIIALREAVRQDGTVPIKLIAPGWGSSGYYPAAVLERDGPATWPAGTKMYWDHPTISEDQERPERSLRDLAAELVTAAAYNANGADGPGLYAESKVFGAFKDSVEELAPHIGVSIRALGKARDGQAEGRSGPIVESLVKGKSVDFVTQAGAGGKVLELFEAARGGNARPAAGRQEAGQVTEQEARELREAAAADRTKVARLTERLILRDADDFAAKALAKIEMPDMTRTRLRESLAGNPPTKDGELDTTAFATRIEEAAKAELAYLAGVTGAGSGRITGMGSGGGSFGGAPVTVEESEKELAEAFRGLGLSESAAKTAAGGRR